MRFALLTPLLMVAPAAHAADEKVAWYADPTTATAMAALIIFFAGHVCRRFPLCVQQA